MFIIQDYVEMMPPVPWRLETCDSRETGDKAGDGDWERLQTAIIVCVTRLGYRLSMDIALDVATNTWVFFLIKTSGDATGSLVTVSNNSGAGIRQIEKFCEKFWCTVHCHSW